VNPHNERNPSFSALIIKSHVKEGVDLAVKHRLPRRVIDVIRQHHGTTLIQYFYLRARGGLAAPFPKIEAATNQPFPFPAAGPKVRPAEVSENTYRYDGPKPQFKESAIIMLADAVEAASRSVRKVTPQALSELIEQIFRERIEDQQLDESPLTFEEIAQIKSSFIFTLLNMLHSRVAYPPELRPELPDARAHS
jgi:membrane-associated HD superfamily phosphohydrolase